MKPIFEIPMLFDLDGIVFNGLDNGTSTDDCQKGCSSGCRSGCDVGGGANS